jgi:hypothetical protein
MIEKHDERRKFEENNDEGNEIKYGKPGSEHEIDSEKNQDYVWWLI